jgi:MYXO-CTERM domain-containing protein
VDTVPAYKNRKVRFATRSGADRLGSVARRTRINLALTLLAIAIVLNLVLLFSGDTSPGWPLAAVILLGAAGALMLSQRREY